MPTPTIITGSSQALEPEEDTDAAIKPFSERLLTELSTYRTLALREALAVNTAVAITALLHALCLAHFYRGTFQTCLTISSETVTTREETPGLADSGPARAIAAMQTNWKANLPKNAADLWDALKSLSEADRTRLLAYCTAQSLNAHYHPWHGTPGAAVHSAILASDLKLDITATGWKTTAANYLDRVPKPRILEAVREAKGDQFADMIAHLRKSEMATEAERMLAGTNWLPEPLRSDAAVATDNEAETTDAEDMPDFLADEPKVDCVSLAAE